MVLSTISHGPHLLITRVVSFSRHHASGRGCKERQNTTVGADVCPSKLVDLEPNLPFEQSITTSSGLHLGHLFYRILFCSFVYVSPTQWHTLEGCPDPTECSEEFWASEWSTQPQSAWPFTGSLPAMPVVTRSRHKTPLAFLSSEPSCPPHAKTATLWEGAHIPNSFQQTKKRSKVNGRGLNCHQ